MHRHVVVVSFLEWLNWHDKGGLRVAADRLVWCAVDSEASAFISSLQFAPDFETLDDAFLIAEITVPPRVIAGGLLWLALDGVKFSALSERSSRLLSPAAERMNAALGMASAVIQKAWVRWKDCSRIENADQQARRLWAWAFDRAWPTDPDRPEERWLGQTRVRLDNMTKLLATNVPLRERVSGTSAEAWMLMALAAEEAGLLDKDKDADWRRTTRAYIGSCLSSARIAPSFLRMEDDNFRQAFESLPCDRPAMIELVAIATGAHHALRIVGGQAPDIGSLEKDLQALTKLAVAAEIGETASVPTMTLLSLGRLLPGSAIVALRAREDAPAGWASCHTEVTSGGNSPNGGAFNVVGTPSSLAAEGSELDDPAATVEIEGRELVAGLASPDAERNVSSREDRPSPFSESGGTPSLFPTEGNNDGSHGGVGLSKGKPSGRRGRKEKVSPSTS